MKYVFTGIQWCGKWTQARILSQKYGFKLLEMWAEFRRVIESGSFLWLELKTILESGALVGEDLWRAVMEKVLQENQEENIIYDAFVRLAWNKEIFDQEVPDYKVIFFNFSKEKATARLLWRMYDPVSWETFVSWTTHNPVTGTALIKRHDDNEKAILTRINAFVNETLPIVEIEKAEWRVIEINADQSVEAVAEEIRVKLGL